MPRGVDEEVRELMASTFWRMTVQMDAPMRRRTLPRQAKDVDRKKKTVCLTTPLSRQVLVQRWGRVDEPRWKTDVARAKTAHRAPSSNIQ